MHCWPIRFATRIFQLISVTYTAIVWHIDAISIKISYTWEIRQERVTRYSVKHGKPHWSLKYHVLLWIIWFHYGIRLRLFSRIRSSIWNKKADRNLLDELLFTISSQNLLTPCHKLCMLCVMWRVFPCYYGFMNRLYFRPVMIIWDNLKHSWLQ